MKKNLFYFLAIALSIVLVSCEKPGDSTKPGGGSNSHAGGVLNGEFSISQTKKVRFSQGNLQYQATTKTWRFAENQYDFIGNYNAKIAETYDGWIDMFGWATSGYNDKMPTLNDRYDFEYVEELVSIAGTNSDWGVYNAISNGGNKAGLWRTLTIEEWQYLLEQRPNAETKKAVASINGNNGVNNMVLGLDVVGNGFTEAMPGRTVTINKYYIDGSSSPITNFEPGKVYRFAIKFSQDNFNKTTSAQVKVNVHLTIANWIVEDTTVGFETDNNTL